MPNQQPKFNSIAIVSSYTIDILVRYSSESADIGYAFAEIIEGEWDITYFHNYIRGPIRNFSETLEVLNEGNVEWEKYPADTPIQEMLDTMLNWVGGNSDHLKIINTDRYDDIRITSLTNQLSGSSMRYESLRSTRTFA